MTGLMGGEVDMVVIGITNAVAQIQAGKVRGLAVLSTARVPSLPDVPTAKEAGIENFEVTSLVRPARARGDPARYSSTGSTPNGSRSRPIPTPRRRCRKPVSRRLR